MDTLEFGPICIDLALSTGSLYHAKATVWCQIHGDGLRWVFQNPTSCSEVLCLEWLVGTIGDAMCIVLSDGFSNIQAIMGKFGFL
jgi:hypothetical protein